ncbi:MAG TPA: PQQ-dependent sugar dehydrogenase [Terriglobales bacterium]|nr:PQQ-dependent sugar dehydrogenase [Terriglobales bacterium]
MPARPVSLLLVVVLTAAGLVLLCSCGTTPPPPLTLSLTTVVSGLGSPVDLQVPSDNTGRFFVVEQPGTIRIISNGALLATPFLDITSQVDFGGEKGLLGLAFHPSYSQNRRFYVNYDRVSGGQMQTVISEFQASAINPNLADATTERILFTVVQPFPNHKGGQLVFGPDGFLYIGLGDGGSGGDPLRNGQSLQTMLGKMLRIDVDHTSSGLAYAIPPDNPFAAGGGLPEIWAYGLRNPWRFSFDRSTSRLFCADVGQDHYEEVDILQKGGDFGWNIMEGLHCFNPATGCNMNGLILPIAEYDHTEGDAVIGGYVYHGTAIPQLAGTYLLSDFGSGTIWNLTESPPGTWTRTRLLSTGRNISSFGQDPSGELYVLDYGGSVLKLVAK